MLGTAVAELDLGAHGGQKIARGVNVAHLWNIFQDHGLISEERRCHAGKSGVFRAADADGAEERFAAADDEFIHFEMSP
jgi:hypothetical protein